jgi:hypothetical protein
MAVVVWLFASAGHSEIRALPEFLNKNFPQLTFVRKFPISRKPAPKLRSDRVPTLAHQGASGYGLAKCITQVLKDTFYKGEEICDLILVIDDLDCCNQVQRTRLFMESVERAVTELQTSHRFTIEQIAKITDISRHIAFAVPEIESWIIADWSNTIANNSSKFRTREVVMKRYLQTKGIACDSPESFGELDPIKQTCKEKLSEILIESSRLNFEQTSVYGLEIYSKALDTPEMLRNLDIQTVSAKCPYFRNLCNYLNVFSRNR